MLVFPFTSFYCGIQCLHSFRCNGNTTSAVSFWLTAAKHSPFCPAKLFQHHFSLTQHICVSGAVQTESFECVCLQFHPQCHFIVFLGGFGGVLWDFFSM